MTNRLEFGLNLGLSVDPHHACAGQRAACGGAAPGMQPRERCGLPVRRAVVRDPREWILLSNRVQRDVGDGIERTRCGWLNGSASPGHLEDQVVRLGWGLDRERDRVGWEPYRRTEDRRIWISYRAALTILLETLHLWVGVGVRR